MKRRKVLIGYALRGAHTATLQELPQALRARFQALDPEAKLVFAPVPLDPEPQVRMRAGSREELLRYTHRFLAAYLEGLHEADVLFTLFAPVNVLERAPRARWIANAGSGAEQYQAHGILVRG